MLSALKSKWKVILHFKGCLDVHSVNFDCIDQSHSTPVKREKVLCLIKEDILHDDNKTKLT